MIQYPKRSVTRFFIPMIDVLILLFCIFLLMPFVKSSGGTSDEAVATLPEAPMSSPDTATIESLRREVERLRRERAEALKSLMVKPLEIDRNTGRLYFYAGGERLEVRHQEDASKLIEHHRREARLQGRDLYYLFLYPRSLSGYPTERQVREYQRWFQEVPHGFDNPLAR
jgi:hypothetical protein